MVLENRLSPWKTQVGHFGCSLSVKDPSLQHTKAQRLTERVDGGGIRGLSSIMILRDIMKGVNEGLPPSDILQPWQVFDMIGGTNTGGWVPSSLSYHHHDLLELAACFTYNLNTVAHIRRALETCLLVIADCMYLLLTTLCSLIAVMLGRLRMNLDECEDAYTRMSERIFKPRRSSHNYLGRSSDFLGASGQFDSEELKDAIKDIIVNHQEQESALLKNPESSCKVYVFCHHHIAPSHLVFHS